MPKVAFGFVAMVRDAILRIAPHHEARKCGGATSPNLILRSGRKPRLEGWRHVAALSFAMLAFAGPARAQTDDYPSRTVTFICPFPAGGGTDILVRLLAAELQDKLSGR